MSDTPQQPGAGQPTTVTVRIDPELLRMARIICAHTPGRAGKQLKIVDYIDSLVRKQITDQYERVMEEVAESRKPKPRRRADK